MHDGWEILFAGMCLCWLVVFPLSFARRKHFGGPDLTIIALCVAIYFFGAPFVSLVNVVVDLPTCNSPEVVRVLEKVIRGLPIGANANSIDGHVELKFDRKAETRFGQCVVHTDTGDIDVKYLVQWLDRDKRKFVVKIPVDLPSCTGPEVAKLLEQVIPRTLIGATLKAIDGHREVSYDRDASARHGKCVAHTDAGDVPVTFVVEWQDRSKGLFQLRTVATPD